MKQQAGKVIVFGEALIDDLVTEQVVGGAPFNVARHLAAFGAAPTMVTRIGNDRNGAAIRDQFARFGMSQAALQFDDSAPTGRVLVERSDGGHRFVIMPDQAYDQIDAGTMERALAGTHASVIYFGTLAQRAARSRAALHKLLDGWPARRYLDLNVREGVTERIVFESLHRADIVKVNEDELHELFRCFTHRRPIPPAADSAEVRASCAILMRVFALEGMIVTLGERGAVYYGADGSVAGSGAAAAVRVVDTVGAGDAFSAVFLLGQERGWPLETTLARANEFAAAVCTIAGAVPADTGFYAEWTGRWLASGERES